MKLFVLLLVVVSVSFARSQYNTKYDNVDVDGILQNNRILTSYIKCILDMGTCTAEGRELRSKKIFTEFHKLFLLFYLFI